MGFSAILTHDCDVKARSKTAAAVAIMMHVTAVRVARSKTKTNGEWDNHADSMLLLFL